MAQSVTRRTSDALVLIRERREAAAEQERRRAAAAVQAAEARRAAAADAVSEAAAARADAESAFRGRTAGGIVSPASLDGHQAVLRRLEERRAEAAAGLRAAEEARNEALAGAEAARARLAACARALDVARKLRTKALKAEAMRLDMLAEWEMDDVTTARFMAQGGRP